MVKGAAKSATVGRQRRAATASPRHPRGEAEGVPLGPSGLPWAKGWGSEAIVGQRAAASTGHFDHAVWYASLAEVGTTSTAERSWSKLKLGPSGSDRLPLRLLRPEMSCAVGKARRRATGRDG